MVDAVLALPEDTKLMILAPLVVGRKGEHLELFDELRAQGFVRVRVDGKVHEIDALPKLDKNKKHTIEVVVDRLKVRADVKQRLAESFETALRHADGRALAVEMDSGKEHLFSAKFACPVCGYSLPELEPRLFSFNNPMGACPNCDGLGQIKFFDPARIVAFPHLSLASGAIKGWDKRNQFYFQMLQSLAMHYGFDLDTPWESLPERIRDVILNGSGQRGDRIPDAGAARRLHAKSIRSKACSPTWQRRYHETDSMAVREELAKYLNKKPCPACNGTRLREEARHVMVGGAPIYEVSAMPLKQALAFFETLKLDGHRAQIADRIVKEIIARLSFLNNVGLDYLSLDRSADTLSGGEAQRIRLAIADRLRPDRRDVRAGRAVDRPAPARQRPPARHAEAPARHRQHGAGGRARRGRDPRRRLRGRHGPRRRRAWRRSRRGRHARRHPPDANSRSPGSTCRAGAASPSRKNAASPIPSGSW